MCDLSLILRNSALSGHTVAIPVSTSEVRLKYFSPGLHNLIAAQNFGIVWKSYKNREQVAHEAGSYEVTIEAFCFSISNENGYVVCMSFSHW